MAEEAVSPHLINGMTPSQYEDFIERLSTIDDPELGVNIVDLGLIYDMALSKDNVLWLLMTLTYAGCPLSDMISDAIHDCLLGSGVTAEIQWTFSPPWDISRLTDEGRQQMIALGAQLPYV